MPPDPPSSPPDTPVIKKICFYILKKLDSLSVLTWYRQETLIADYTQRSTPLKEK